MQNKNNYILEVNNLSKIYNFNKKLNNKSPLTKVALNQVSFKLQKGETLGIVGDNGSGKSTLLKIISGITKPTKGNVIIRGKIVSILEVGTGFHQDLSGRENIYYTGSFYGMSKKELKAIENEIIEFSELNEYIDIPVKHYSSGMFMRLAFSLIAHLDADIILLDEVFSVGDISFKQKCENWINLANKENKTILFVSHEISAIARICQKYIVLKDGEIVNHKKDINAIFNYINSANKINYPTIETKGKTNNKLKIVKREVVNNISEKSVELSNFENASIKGPIFIKCFTNNKDGFDTMHSIDLEISYYQKIDELVLPNIDITYLHSVRAAAINPLVCSTGYLEKFSEKGIKKIMLTIPNNFLNVGIFTFNIFFSNHLFNEIYSIPNAITIQVKFNKKMEEKYFYDGKYTGPFIPKFKWEVNHIEN
jgi:ABC-type polysaccharide/polyol phosphate transport system ATPase subunit